MNIKNIYGIDVIIPFGDWEPDSVWHQSPNGKVGVVDSDDYCGNFGKFSKDAYQEILESLAQFKQEYTWVEAICKWLPNEMVDK